MSEADSRIIYLEMETKPSVLGNRLKADSLQLISAVG